MSLEAKSCGCKVISYAGNDYADFWITEGDQREQAKQLLGIFKGEIQARPTLAIPDIKETAKQMLEIYGGLL
jgi:hypothetical protein